MAGSYLKPKGFNRRFFINIGTVEAPLWAELARGVTSRGTSISETTTDYIDMASRGVAETITESVKVQRSFSVYRILGDEAQEAIVDRLYAVDRREMEYMSFYDNLPTNTPNGEQGRVSLSITDDGSGDAKALETMAFALTNIGKPRKGIVTLGANNVPTFKAVP